MGAIAMPIMTIRESLKEIKVDTRGGKMPKIILQRFINCVENVCDMRVDSMVTYPLTYILLLAFFAVLSGADGWTDIESFSISYKKQLNGIFPKFKELDVPSHDTFRRVMGLLKPEELQAAVSTYLVEQIESLKKSLKIEDNKPRLISVDGKEQKGTGRKYNTKEQTHNLQTLHVYDVSNGICLASVPIKEKTNEIPTAQEILRQMMLKNCIITFDAMNTQKETVKVIVKNGGDYVGGLKGNHQLFHGEVMELFTDQEIANIRKNEVNYRTYTEKAHNRIEKRSYYMTTDIKWFAELELWPNLKAFVCYDVETEDLVTGKKTFERRYYISSLESIELVSESIRGHWCVENQLHWHLDVTFSEDDNTTMDQNAFNNLSIINKMVLSLLKILQPTLKRKIGLKIIRKTFGWDLMNQLANMLSVLDENVIEKALSVGRP